MSAGVCPIKFCILTSAPFSTKILVMFRFPVPIDQLLCIFILKNSSTISNLPVYIAVCNAVSKPDPRALTSAPCSSSAFTIFSCVALDPVMDDIMSHGASFDSYCNRIFLCFLGLSFSFFKTFWMPTLDFDYLIQLGLISITIVNSFHQRSIAHIVVLNIQIDTTV